MSAPDNKDDTLPAMASKVTSEVPNQVVSFENDAKLNTSIIYFIVSPSPPEDNSQSARRTVSGKTRHFIGKIGDLKILSSMETPPLSSEERTDEEDSVAFYNVHGNVHTILNVAFIVLLYDLQCF